MVVEWSCTCLVQKLGQHQLESFCLFIVNYPIVVLWSCHFNSKYQNIHRNILSRNRNNLLETETIFSKQNLLETIFFKEISSKGNLHEKNLHERNLHERNLHKRNLHERNLHERNLLNSKQKQQSSQKKVFSKENLIF